jgi:hypothetical protein
MPKKNINRLYQLQILEKSMKFFSEIKTPQTNHDYKDYVFIINSVKSALMLEENC